MEYVLAGWWLEGCVVFPLVPSGEIEINFPSRIYFLADFSVDYFQHTFIPLYAAMHYLCLLGTA